MDRVSAGGGSFSGSDPFACVLVAPAAGRACRTAVPFRAGEGDRDPAASPPAARARASDRSSAANAGRSSVVDGVQPRAAPAGVATVGVCDAGGAAALAPRPRRAPLDVSAPASRPAGDRRRSPGPHRAARTGEPELGVPTDPGRAGRNRSQARREHRLVDPEGGRDRAGAEAARAKLGRVPTSASGEHPRVRLPHRRHALPQALLRLVLHRSGLAASISLASPRIRMDSG
jgi:hypothetical protein